MSDIPFEPGASGATDDAGEPVRELAELREEPSGRFVHQVMDVIHARQSTTHLIEMHWWGLTGLAHELFDTLCRAIGVREEGPRDPRA
jgi:hypothetical protein